MPNLKKIDDKDFVFLKKILTDKEEQEFSDFLEKRKKHARSVGKRSDKASPRKTTQA